MSDTHPPIVVVQWRFFGDDDDSLSLTQLAPGETPDEAAKRVIKQAHDDCGIDFDPNETVGDPSYFHINTLLFPAGIDFDEVSYV